MNKFYSKITVLALALFLNAPINAQIRTDFDRRMNKHVEPFKIIGNIYYVGASDVASYLIITPEGHILIDGGFLETVPMIEENIKKLSFNLKDVKILLNNHAHYDHAGGLKFLKEKTNAKLYASREEKILLENGGTTDFAFGDQYAFIPVKVDKVLEEGDVVVLGNTKLKTFITPGHTKGCTTWTTEVEENSKKLDVIFLCSTSTLNYDLINNRNYPNIAQDFANTFSKLQRIKADVFLSSHAGFFQMRQKLEKIKEDKSQNLFIDSEGYKKFLERMEKQFKEKLNTQKSNEK